MAAWVTRHLLQHEPQECTVVIVLDAKHRVLESDVVAQGWGQAARLTVRHVLDTVERLGAPAFLLGRSRMDGNTLPYPTDQRIARLIRHAAEVRGIHMVDHVIVGASSSYWSEVEDKAEPDLHTTV